jgi:hypothetical protein
MTAGRRRRGSKKSRKSTRRQRGGAMYGFGGAMGTNGPVWGGVANTNFVNSATGQEIPNDAAKVGGRRKSRKGSKKSRRKMRGGASQVSMGTTGAAFTGSGSRGIADYSQYTQPGNAY